MGYALEAVVLDQHAANSDHGLPAVRLPHGFSLVPITDDLFDSLPLGRAEPRLSAPFRKFSAGLEALLTELSLTGRAAYVEADFFGGSGTQAAAVWHRGVLSWGPERTAGRGAINGALRALGVPHSPAALLGRDEFDTLGLGQCRHTADWLEERQDTG